MYALAWRRGATGYRIILVGIGVSWICTSATDYLVARGADSSRRRRRSAGWSATSTAAAGSQVVPLASPWPCCCRPRCCSRGWMRTLQLGDDVATGLGTRVQPVRLGLLLAGVGLVAFATAAAGPGRLRRARRPQIAQRLAGTPSPPPLASGLTGAFVVLGSDLLARTLVPAPNCRSASSPACSARRSCCGCSSAPTAPAQEADHGDTDPDAARRAASTRWPTTTGRWWWTAWTSTVPDRPDHGHRRRQRLRQVDPAARPGPAAAPRAGACTWTAARCTPCRPARSPSGWASCRRRPVAPEGLTVVDLVSRGRFTAPDLVAAVVARRTKPPCTTRWPPPSMTDLADRPVDELSGGQRQRAWIAMAVAQGTPVLLLDEPTTYLDLAHQIDVLDLIIDLNRREGRTVVMVLHDLNQACRYADHVVAMKSGPDRRRGRAGGRDHRGDRRGRLRRALPDHHRPGQRHPMVIPIGRHHLAPVN